MPAPRNVEDVGGARPSGRTTEQPTSPDGDGPSVRPRVSVVVAAHTRVEFLKRAVASAVGQLPEEVLVVKFRRDAELDRELAQMGARVHVTREPYQGGKMAEGIELATGDVVVFLDDDDVLLPGKVERVREVFADPRVVFHANRYVPFTDTPPEQSEMGPVRYFDTGESDQFREGLRPVIASCASVRKETFGPWLPALRSLTIADHTTFIMAVTARRRMAMDRSVLTGYHVNWTHGALRSSNTIWNRPGASAKHDIAWMLDLLDATQGGVRATLTPVVANAIINLVFVTGETEFHEYHRTMRAVLDGVGVRRPLTVPTILFFGYPLAPRLAVSLGRIWKELVGYHHTQAK